MSAGTAETDLRRKLRVRMRPDLRCVAQFHGGKRFHVVKDPVNLKYYRFRPEEMFLLNLLDGRRNLEDVRQEFAAEFRPQRLSLEDLERFVRQLLQSGLATVDTPQLGHRLYQRAREKRWQKVKQTFLNLMYLKIPVFDPDRLLSAMLPWTRFLYTLPFFAFAVAFWLSAGGLALLHWDAFSAKLPNFEDFFRLENIVWLWAATGAVKVVHEFSHGLSCKRFGGECHEMGFMLLALSPALYANVTDAWMIPNKWHRAAIGAAGIYVELIIAAAAMWVWWFTGPGMLNFLCLSTIFVCSVSTVVFNGNPLMRFDGYYVLSDVLEIPNLRERANKYLGNLASQAVLGKPAVPDAYGPGRWRGWFAAFAVASYGYKWVVSFGIIAFLTQFLRPYKLQVVGLALAYLTVFSMTVLPLWNIRRTLQREWRRMNVDKSRMARGLAVAAAVVAAALFVPFPTRLDLPMALQARRAATVFPPVAGALAEIRVKDGDAVEPGMALATLDNPELRKERGRLELERDLQEARIRQANAAGDHAVEAEAASERAALVEQLKLLDVELKKLVLRVPPGVRGVVMAPPRTHETGRWYRPGEEFCRIGVPDDVEVFAVLEHGDVPLVHSGSRAWLKINGQVGAIRECWVERIAESALQELPPALSNRIKGGRVPTTARPDAPATAAERKQKPKDQPLARSYSVAAAAPNPDGDLRPGLRGTLRVDAGLHSLWWRLARYLRRTFDVRA